MMREVVAVLLLLQGAATTALGQSVPLDVRVLGAQFQEFPEPFSHIGELAEFPDRRILVVDFRENRVLLVDFARETVHDAARVGSGPREFRSLSPVIAMPDGRVLGWDVAQDRILTFDTNGRPSGTRPANVVFGEYAYLPRVVDSAGALYGEYRGWRRSNGTMVDEDSTAVIRQRRRIDTIALIRPERAPYRSVRDRYAFRPTGFAPFDAWGVFPDGTVLIVRGADYSVDVVSPNGQARRLPSIPFERVPVTRADRDGQMRALQQGLDDGRRRAGESGRLMAGVRVVEPLQWAEFKPAVSDVVVRIDSKNRAWVAVHSRSDSVGRRFDVFDARGRRLFAVRLARGEQLIGFGRNAVFTVRRDADDLEFLRRYPLP
jgi:hypothetical protein